MNSIEVWKDIKDYEGLYQVSSFGRIKSLERYKKNHNKLQKVEEKMEKKVKYLLCMIDFSNS